VKAKLAFEAEAKRHGVKAELPPYSSMHNEDGQMQSMYTYGLKPFVVQMKPETQHQPKVMTNAP
jgi:hypothetical protein